MQISGQAQAAVWLLIESYEGLGSRESVYALRHLQGLCMVYYRQAGILSSKWCKLRKDSSRGPNAAG